LPILQNPMIGDRQDQHAGDSSVNIQGRDISVGLSYSDARQVAMDVFESNFHRLSSIASETARTRAEELLDAYLKETASAGVKEIPEAQNPDFQYAVFTAQREYARSGDKDLGELLVQLLVDRTKQTDRNLLQIVLNESLVVAPKLTVDQLDALSLVFLVRYTKHHGLTTLDALNQYLEKYLLPFATNLPTKVSAYQHLEFASCGAISIGSISLAGALLRTYPGLFSSGFTEAEILTALLDRALIQPLLTPCLHSPDRLQLSGLDDDVIAAQCKNLNLADDICSRVKNLQNSHLMGEAQVKDYVLRAKPESRIMFERWESTELQNMTLTSVGIAIAHANIRRRTGEAFDLSIWM